MLPKRTTVKLLDFSKVNASMHDEQFPFATEMLCMGKSNKIGIECADYWIRIDGVEVSENNTFVLLMDRLIELAEKNDYEKIVFCDVISDKLLSMFKGYGFVENENTEKSDIHYLVLAISEE